MQKKLLALAIAGLSSAAFAQSNVTISGAMEAHFEQVSAKGATAAASDLVSRSRVTDNTSWLRFSGSENLGNGLTAFWQVESDVGLDNIANGTAGATGFGNRNSGVGIKGAWGGVLLGHWDAQYQASLEGGVDFGSAGALPHSANLMNVHSKIGNTLIGGRLNNVIAYLLPDFNGFSGRIAYAAGGTDANENTANGVPAKNTGWTAFFKYANGPINAFYSHLAVDNAGAFGAVATACVNNTTGAVTVGAACGAGTTAVAAIAGVATSGSDLRSDKLGGAYTFPMGLKVGLVWDRTKNTVLATGVTTKRTAWALPISYSMGAHGFYFGYGKHGQLNVGGADVPNTAAKNTVLAYTYSLSKRTQIGASWSRISNDSASAIDFWTRGAGMTAAQAGADPTSFSVGINHAF